MESQRIHQAGRCNISYLDATSIITCGSEGSLRRVTFDPTFNDTGSLLYEDSNYQFTVTCPCNNNNDVLKRKENEMDFFIDCLIYMYNEIMINIY